MTKNDQCRLDNLLAIADEPATRHGHAMTEWERKFVRDLDARFRDRQLSPKQRGAFDLIVQKHLVGDDD